MNEPYYPFRIKYKGYTITQTPGEVIISRYKHEVLTIPTQRPRTTRELAELFDFNARIYGFIEQDKKGDKNDRTTVE